MKHDPLGQSPCRIRAVLVIDDHPLYGDALASTLQHVYRDCRIETATTLADGLARLGPDFAPDLVMLDLRLPDVTGISGFIRVRDRLPDTPVVVISALSSPDLVHTLMEEGAAGFIPKDAPVTAMQEALCEIRAGRHYLPAAYARGGRAPTLPPDVQVISRRIAELTPQQARIMKLICAGKPNKQIAYELSLAEATVKAHITALLRRLGVQNRTQAAVLVESVSLEAGAGSRLGEAG